MKFEGQAALITGSSRGVGRALAMALAERGCAVAVNYRRSREEAEETAAAVRARGVAAACVQADTAEDAACRMLVERAAAELGRLDILVNNAATTAFIAHDDLEAVSGELWDRIFAVNVRGAFQCARAARRHLAASGAGQIVNVASVAGISHNGSSIPYCASKAALISLTASLARTLAPKIRVNGVAPGFIESRWTVDGLGERYDAVVAATRSRAPLGRVCRPEDVADAILALLGGSRLVTGQTLVCDGGSLLGPRG